MLDACSGWLPECRGATKQQFIQGGSSEYIWCHSYLVLRTIMLTSVDADPILGEFFVKYASLP